MDIHPSVLAGDITRQAIYDAIDHAFITTHIGNGPTQLLILGKDETGRVLEITAVVTNEDLFILFAADARSEYLALAHELDLVPEWSDGEKSDVPTSKYGASTDGIALTDALIDELYAAAESGYDIERLRTRTRPGRPAPLAVGRVVRVGLDPGLNDAATRTARAHGVAVEALIQQALEGYLHASSDN
jgi:hypothetical protein